MDLPLFVCIEGLDGSGKSTLLEALSHRLGDEGIDFIVTSEPTDGPIGKSIKRYLAISNRARDVAFEALMFAADRLWHIASVVEPALDRGQLVITDRYKYSSMAYQSRAGDMIKWVEDINRFAPDADLAVFLDTDPEACISRLEGSRSTASVMENLETLWEIYGNYRRLVELGKLTRVDAERDQNQVADEVLNMILAKQRQSHA
ncbi:MAG: dTMP kinase [Candidatus Geothermarchaeales archaeon]